MPRTIRLAIGTIFATAALVGGGTAAVQAGGANQVVLAQATADGQTVDRSGLQIASYGGDTADSANIAEAQSHDCTGCGTVAVAVQVLFVTGDPHTVSPG